MQSEKGRQIIKECRHAADTNTLPADGLRAASQWTALSAEFSARKLDGLSLLGYRTRALRPESGLIILELFGLSFLVTELEP